MLLVYCDLTHHIWYSGIVTDPILEGDVLLEAQLANEYGSTGGRRAYTWGLSDFVLGIWSDHLL